MKSTSGLPFELWAFRCFFPGDNSPITEANLPKRQSVLVADSMLRGLQAFGWPSSLEVNVRIGGAKMEVLCRILASCFQTRAPSVAVLHGGINDFGKLDICAPGASELLRVFRVASGRLKTEYPECQFVMSSVCTTRSSSVNRSVAVVNTELRGQCKVAGWHFLSNDHVTQQDLADDVHLTVWGKLKLHRKLQMLLRTVLGRRSGAEITIKS